MRRAWPGRMQATKRALYVASWQLEAGATPRVLAPHVNKLASYHMMTQADQTTSERRQGGSLAGQAVGRPGGALAMSSALMTRNDRGDRPSPCLACLSRVFIRFHPGVVLRALTTGHS
jgi:hypothetical protein